MMGNWYDKFLDALTQIVGLILISHYGCSDDIQSLFHSRQFANSIYESSTVMASWYVRKHVSLKDSTIVVELYWPYSQYISVFIRVGSSYGRNRLLSGGQPYLLLYGKFICVVFCQHLPYITGYVCSRERSMSNGCLLGIPILESLRQIVQPFYYTGSEQHCNPHGTHGILLYNCPDYIGGNVLMGQ